MDNSKNDNPLITIIVSIYNAEKTLKRFLDSLAFQTSRNFEVIIVNKASTDRSKEIAILYAEQYPEVFKYYDRPYSLSPSTAAAFALKIAKGEYITRCDPDDWYELDAVNTMEEAIKEQSADIYCFLANKVILDPNRYEGVVGFPEPLTMSSFLCGNYMLAYWNKLFKRELYDNVPYLETDYTFDDWAPNLIYGSYAKKIVPIKKVIYNYVVGIGIMTLYRRFDKSVITIFDHVLNNCNPEYLDEIYYAIFFRAQINYYKFPATQREVANWAIKHKPAIENNKFINNDVFLKKELEKIYNHKEKKIPNIAYLNGFDKEYSEETVDDLRKKLFLWGDGEIIILNEQQLEKCPDSIRSAYHNGNRKYAIDYVTLQSISETGGYFIGNRVRSLYHLNQIDAFYAFFSYETDSTVTDEIFGSAPNYSIINELLDTYKREDFYADRYLPLKDRIKNILCAKYDLKLDGKKAWFDGIMVFPVDMFVVNFLNGKGLTYLDYSDMANDPEYLVVNRNNLNNICEAASQVCSAAEYKRLKSIEARLRDIEKSDTFKGAMRIKKFANTKFGRPFKKIFKWFLKKYRKHKYGM